MITVNTHIHTYSEFWTFARKFCVFTEGTKRTTSQNTLVHMEKLHNLHFWVIYNNFSFYVFKDTKCSYQQTLHSASQTVDLVFRDFCFSSRGLKLICKHKMIVNQKILSLTVVSFQFATNSLDCVATYCVTLLNLIKICF